MTKLPDELPKGNLKFDRLSALTPEQEDRVREIVKEELDKIRIDIAKQSKLPILDSDLQNIKGW